MPEIRTQHAPGKYEGEPLYAPILHEIAMMGAEDECGDSCDGSGYFWLLDGPVKIDQNGDAMTVAEIRATLNEAEIHEISTMAGAILMEACNGFVYVETFDCPVKLARKWAEIRAEVDESDDSEE